MSVNFVYLDEFGHNGPFISRSSPKYNESPVFGLAGVILPENAVRPFATHFLKLKEYLFATEIANSGKIAANWEKHGSEIFTPKDIARYPHFRATGFRLLNSIRDSGARVFYYGREKISGTVDVNSRGLYTTVLSHAINQLERFSESAHANYILVTDEHSSRKRLLATATKTMYGDKPARHLLSPPFEVESYANQNIQAADWVAAIVGRLWAYEVNHVEYADHLKFRTYFWDRLHRVVTHSTVLPR